MRKTALFRSPTPATSATKLSSLFLGTGHAPSSVDLLKLWFDACCLLFLFAPPAFRDIFVQESEYRRICASRLTNAGMQVLAMDIRTKGQNDGVGCSR